MNIKKSLLILAIFSILLFSYGRVSFAQAVDREALKAELKEELRAEILEEIRIEMLKETQVSVQKATEEATANFKEELRTEMLNETQVSAQKATEKATANFKKELRTEIMEETKTSLGDEIAKWMEESPLLGPFRRVKLAGFVDVNYFYNFRNHGDTPPGAFPAGQTIGGSGASKENALSGLNFLGENEDNSLTFESFAIFLDKEATNEHPIGWQFHTYFGEKAKRITFLGSPDTNDPDRDDIVSVATANISWIAPVSKGIPLTIGKMYTWIGLELVENINNPNYQHGILYNNAIPFTHTGISADLSNFLPSDKLGLTLYGVNGWDSFVDNNESKSFGWYLSYQPNDDFFISLAGIHGAEGWDNRVGRPVTGQRANSNGGVTQMFDVVATYQTPHDPLSLQFNFDWGVAEDGNLRTVGTTPGGIVTNTSTGHWWGVAGYGLYDFTDWIQGVIRYEYFDDTDGVRFFGTTIWETTLTCNIKIRENLLFRPEWRYNNYAIKALGPRGNHTSETMFGAGIEYIF
ncbi:MAG: outer membrane beta-barrel protein [Candidatus Scalinduaceae bacterium]